MKIFKRIGKGAEDFSKISEDFSRIWQVKSSKMIEILPKIFKKTFFIFIFRENLEKSTRSLLGPAQASSGRLRPARASSGQLGPAQASSGRLGPTRASSFLSKNPRPLENGFWVTKIDLANDTLYWKIRAR